LRRLDVERAAGRRASGIADENVDAPQDIRRGVVDGIEVAAKVAHNRVRASASLGVDRVRDGLDLIAAARGQHHAGALGGKTFRRCTAEPAAR
jgi:hypothetical protein